jgi:hypothetical protein
MARLVKEGLMQIQKNFSEMKFGRTTHVAKEWQKELTAYH